MGTAGHHQVERHHMARKRGFAGKGGGALVREAIRGAGDRFPEKNMLLRLAGGDFLKRARASSREDER